VRRLTAALVLALGACAQPGAPPGGPPRHVPPKVDSIIPDSGATKVKAKEVQILFDEVVSEKPAAQGATDLSGLGLISPTDGEVHVGWHRQRLTIHGKHDFKPNTAYTVTLMPGLADLRAGHDEQVRTQGEALRPRRRGGWDCHPLPPRAQTRH